MVLAVILKEYGLSGEAFYVNAETFAPLTMKNLGGPIHM